MKIDLKPLLKRLFSWGKKAAAAEIEAEVQRRLDERLASKTTVQIDTNPSSMTRPEDDPRA